MKSEKLHRQVIDFFVKDALAHGLQERLRT
jgi:hypothetical protein